MRIKERFTVLLLIVPAVIAVDWSIKLLAEQHLDSSAVVYNAKSPAMWALPVIAIAGALILSICSHKLAVLGVAILTGGALANMIDRIVGGPVTDFITLPVRPGGEVYVANLADCAILIGSICLIVGGVITLINRRRERAATKADSLPVSQ